MNCHHIYGACITGSVTWTVEDQPRRSWEFVSCLICYSILQSRRVSGTLVCGQYMDHVRHRIQILSPRIRTTLRLFAWVREAFPFYRLSRQRYATLCCFGNVCSYQVVTFFLLNLLRSPVACCHIDVVFLSAATFFWRFVFFLWCSLHYFSLRLGQTFAFRLVYAPALACDKDLKISLDKKTHWHADVKLRPSIR